MDKYLFQRIDPASMVFFRMAFGVLAFAELMAQFTYYHLYKNFFEAGAFHFSYHWFDWVKPLPGPLLSVLFVFLLICALCIVLGYRYKAACTAVALGLTYTFLLEKTHYLNHGYLFCWLSFLMIFVPANRVFSLDVYRRPNLRLETIPVWPVALLAFLMGVVYFYGGLAKINPDWLRAMPLKLWLAGKGDTLLLGNFLVTDAAAWFMAYGGMIFDLSVPILLLFKRTRIFALCGALFFHLTNTMVFNIGIFPWLSISLTLLFFPPHWPRALADWLSRCLRPVRWLRSKYEERIQSTTPALQSWHSHPDWRPYVLGGLIVISSFHLIYPFRHHVIPGDVAWTEEGHRFSWRMMLRSKRGTGHFLVKDPATGESQMIRPRDYLRPDQTRKAITHPDMILEFAHHLRDLWIEKGVENPEVYARVSIRLNDHPSQDLIDPNVNLSNITWSPWKQSSWITKHEKPEK